MPKMRLGRHIQILIVGDERDRSSGDSGGERHRSGGGGGIAF